MHIYIIRTHTRYEAHVIGKYLLQKFNKTTNFYPYSLVSKIAEKAF